MGYISGMPNEQIDFDDWGEGEVDTLEGARPQPGSDENAMKRMALASNRLMMRPDGTPIPQEVPAQFRQQPQAQPLHKQGRPNPAVQAIAEGYEDMEQLFEEQTAAARSLQETFTEAERRFDKAKYYKLLLGQPIFSDSSAAGQEVEAEVRAFAQERFEVFLGMRQERGAIPAIFDGWEKEDFEVLLVMIRRLRQKPDLMVASKPAAPAAEPTLTARAPQTPTVAAEPSLRPRAPAGTPGKPQQAVSPQGKPKGNQRGPRQRKIRPLIDPYTGQPKVNPETGKPYMQDITGQVRPSPGGEQPIPMQIGRDAVAAIHDRKANEAAQALEHKLARAGEAGMIVRTAATYARTTNLGGHHEDVVYEGADYRPDASMMVANPGEAGYVRDSNV